MAEVTLAVAALAGLGSFVATISLCLIVAAFTACKSTELAHPMEVGARAMGAVACGCSGTARGGGAVLHAASNRTVQRIVSSTFGVTIDMLHNSITRVTNSAKRNV